MSKNVKSTKDKKPLFLSDVYFASIAQDPEIQEAMNIVDSLRHKLRLAESHYRRLHKWHFEEAKKKVEGNKNGRQKQAVR